MVGKEIILWSGSVLFLTKSRVGDKSTACQKKLKPENLHHGDHEVDDKEISDVLLSSSLPFSHFNTL